MDRRHPDGICIAKSATTGRLDPMQVGQCFINWYLSNPKDVGNQTRWVLSRAQKPEDLTPLAEEYCRHTPGAPATGA